MSITKTKPMNKLKYIYSCLICLLFWHRIDANDSGYDICGRCGAHEYYDSGMFNYETKKYSYKYQRSGYLMRPIWFTIKCYRNIKFYIKYKLIAVENDGLPF
jgi:hypothetical protein